MPKGLFKERKSTANFSLCCIQYGLYSPNIFSVPVFANIVSIMAVLIPYRMIFPVFVTFCAVKI